MDIRTDEQKLPRPTRHRSLWVRCPKKTIRNNTKKPSETTTKKLSETTTKKLSETTTKAIRAKVLRTEKIQNKVMTSKAKRQERDKKE